MPDPCKDFADSIDAQIELTESRKNETLFIAFLGILGFDWVWDLVKGDDALRTLVEEIVAALLAGSIVLALRLLGRLFERLGLKKRLGKVIGRFFLFVLVALIAAELYEAYKKREALQLELEEFAIKLAGDPAYEECPEDRRNKILRSRGLPTKR